MKHPRVLVGLMLVTLIGCAHRQTPTVDLSAYNNSIRVACVGDSITYGAGVENREQNNYPVQLARMLGSQWEVRNFGVSGATLLKNGDKPYWKEPAFQQALQWKPDLVIIKLGTNDSKPQNWQHKDQFAADYRDLIAQFRQANPQVRVYLCLPVPAFPGNWGIRDQIIQAEVIPQIRQVARQTDSFLIDLYQPFEGKSQLFPDTVHPNAEGAAEMARTIYQVLTGKQASPPAIRQAA